MQGLFTVSPLSAAARLWSRGILSGGR